MNDQELIPFYTFAEQITPEQAKANGDTRSLRELRKRSRINRRCENCENPVWRYGTGDLCFPCCAGETDAYEYFELRYQP